MKTTRHLSAFGLLNTIQFLAAINENLYKLIAAYFLIYELGESETDTIMSYIGVLFILPFLLFSSLGGIFADKCPKNRIVIWTRLFELVTLSTAVFLFTNKEINSAYLILFLMATFSAIFGPAKYSIIPELIPPHRLLYGNSVIAAFTYLGIIIGTALPSFIIWATNSNFIAALFVSISFAFVGAVLSFFLPKTPIENSHKPIKWFIYSEIWISIKQMSNIPSLLPAVLAYSYLLFIGSFLQLNIIPYTEQTLKFSDIYGGYFFLLTAFGLGAGAFLTNYLSNGKIRLSFIPLSGLMISVVIFLMCWLTEPWWLMVFWMLLIGFFGGTFLVPPQAYILAASPEEDRGRNFATANFLSFAFAMLAALSLYLFNTLLKFSPSKSFAVVGVINLLVMTALIAKTNWLSRGSNPTLE